MASDCQTRQDPVRRYTRQQLMELQTAQTTLATPPPELPDFTPLRDSTGSRRKTFDITYFHGLEDTTEIVVKLWKNIEEFEIFLNLAFMPVDAAEKLLNVLNKVIKCEFEGDCIIRTLKIVCESQFLDSHLHSYTDHLHKCSRDEEVYSRKEMTDILEQILTLLSNICHNLPSEGPKVYSFMAYLKTQGDLINVIKNSEAIAEHFNELLSKCRSPFGTFTTSEYKRDRGRDYCQNLYEE